MPPPLRRGWPCRTRAGEERRGRDQTQRDGPGLRLQPGLRKSGCVTPQPSGGGTGGLVGAEGGSGVAGGSENAGSAASIASV